MFEDVLISKSHAFLISRHAFVDILSKMTRMCVSALKCVFANLVNVLPLCFHLYHRNSKQWRTGVETTTSLCSLHRRKCKSHWEEPPCQKTDKCMASSHLELYHCSLNNSNGGHFAE